MGTRKKAAIYIDESKRRSWKWCGDEVTQLGVLHCLAVSFGFKPHYFRDIADVRLTEEQSNEGRRRLFDAIRKKEFKAVITPNLSHILRSGETESGLRSFFSQHNVSLILIDIREMRPSKWHAENKEGQGFGYIKVGSGE